MKTVRQLNSEILMISMKMEETFPELSKYLLEMPVSISYTSKEDISIQNLTDYYGSLDAVLKNYTAFHKQL